MTINHLRLILLAMWLGAALFFSAAVAPSAFSVLVPLPNGRESAGAIVSLCLALINISGFIISLLVLIAGLFRFRRTVWSVIEAVSLLTIAVATGVGHWIIRARMQALKIGFGLPIDEIPQGDPRRVSFDTLHGYSVKALALAMIAALVALVMIAYRSRTKAAVSLDQKD